MLRLVERRAVRHVIKLTASADSGIRLAAFEALRYLGPAATEYRDEIIDLWSRTLEGDNEWLIVADALNGLADVSKSNSRAVSKLVDVALRNGPNRADAVSFLGELPPAMTTTAVMSAIESGLKSESAGVRLKALDALARQGHRAKYSLQTLNQMAAADAVEDVRHAARQAVKTIQGGR